MKQEFCKGDIVNNENLRTILSYLDESRKTRRKATRRKVNNGKLVQYQIKIVSVNHIYDSVTERLNIPSKGLRGALYELSNFD